MRRFALSTNLIHFGAVIQTPAGFMFAPALYLLKAALAFLLGVMLRLLLDTAAAILLLGRAVGGNLEFHLMIFGLGVLVLVDWGRVKIC
jgi:hypothetical protein